MRTAASLRRCGAQPFMNMPLRPRRVSGVWPPPTPDVQTKSLEGKLVEMVKRLNLLAGRSRDGNPVFEEVLVDPRGTGKYLLMSSPGLVLGVAAGDLIEVSSGGQATVLTRGGNLCIQIFREAGTDAMTAQAEQAAASLGGRLDGEAERVLVATIPVRLGFTKIERVIQDLVDKFPGAQWYYGNVYDPVDGITPLNWWVQTESDSKKN